MKWGKWIQSRIQQLFSTEFLVMIAFMVGVYIIIMEDKMTAVVAGVCAGPMLTIINYARERTKQKGNGG